MNVSALRHEESPTSDCARPTEDDEGASARRTGVEALSVIARPITGGAWAGRRRQPRGGVGGGRRVRRGRRGRPRRATTIGTCRRRLGGARASDCSGAHARARRRQARAAGALGEGGRRRRERRRRRLRGGKALAEQGERPIGGGARLVEARRLSPIEYRHAAPLLGRQISDRADARTSWARSRLLRRADHGARLAAARARLRRDAHRRVAEEDASAPVSSSFAWSRAHRARPVEAREVGTSEASCSRRSTCRRTSRSLSHAEDLVPSRHLEGRAGRTRRSTACEFSAAACCGSPRSCTRRGGRRRASRAPRGGSPRAASPAWRGAPPRRRGRWAPETWGGPASSGGAEPGAEGARLEAHGGSVGGDSVRRLPRRPRRARPPRLGRLVAAPRRRATSTCGRWTRRRRRRRRRARPRVLHRVRRGAAPPTPPQAASSSSAASRDVSTSPRARSAPLLRAQRAQRRRRPRARRAARAARGLAAHELPDVARSRRRLQAGARRSRLPRLPGVRGRRVGEALAARAS